MESTEQHRNKAISPGLGKHSIRCNRSSSPENKRPVVMFDDSSFLLHTCRMHTVYLVEKKNKNWSGVAKKKSWINYPNCWLLRWLSAVALKLKVSILPVIPVRYWRQDLSLGLVWNREGRGQSNKREGFAEFCDLARFKLTYWHSHTQSVLFWCPTSAGKPYLPRWKQMPMF